MAILPKEVISIAVPVLLYILIAVILRCAPKNYPEYHTKYPYASYFGLRVNLGNIKIDDVTWRRFKRSGFNSFLVAALFHSLTVIFSIIVIPNWDINKISWQLFLIYSVFAITYVFVDISIHNK